jgi:SAM-dependent methyltransferase
MMPFAPRTGAGHRIRLSKEPALMPADRSPWSTPDTVAGFAHAAPNAVLVRYAEAELRRGGRQALDLGCGAGRNAVPLAQQGWEVTGIDDSAPMLAGAQRRSAAAGVYLKLALATMDHVPVNDRSCDLVVAHGIWNLARTGAEFRMALREAARAARPGAGLFVFTFSRNTFGPDAQPGAGETFVFTEFSGQPQCFLTAEQLVAELGAVGFAPDDAVPLTEYKRPAASLLRAGAAPAILEAAFRFAP